MVYNETNYENSAQKKLINTNAKFDFNIYPNPTTGIVYVEIDNYNDSPIPISVYDYSGSLIYNLVANQSFISIDLSDMKPGIYFMIISDGNQNVTRKIIKN